MQSDHLADLRVNLLDYTYYIFKARRNHQMMRAAHQEIICSALERVVIGECSRLIINVPPRSGKTEIAVICFISWCLGNFPFSEFIHASYSKRLASYNAFAVRETIKHEEYKKIFPLARIRDDSRAKDEFHMDQGGVVYATGAEGSITGRGAGRVEGGFGGAILIDDPHKPGEAASEVMRENVIDWFGTTIESRKNNQQTPIIIIMQRLHERDLSGWLLAGGNGEEWESIIIPAIDKKGESFWPEHFSISMLRRLEATNPYVFAGQYMQRPAPKGGGMFPVNKFAIIESPPHDSDIIRSIRYWDKAGTAGRGAYTAGVLMHLLKDGRYVVADVVRGQWSAIEREQKILRTAMVDGKKTKIYVEQEPGSGGKESAESTVRMLSGFSVYTDRVTGQKDIRAEPYAAQVQGGNVCLVRSEWNRVFLSEHESFPAGQYKDQVDAATGAFNKFSINSQLHSKPIRGLI